jgi:hypothetical protein
MTGKSELAKQIGASSADAVGIKLRSWQGSADPCDLHQAFSCPNSPTWAYTATAPTPSRAPEPPSAAPNPSCPEPRGQMRLSGESELGAPATLASPSSGRSNSSGPSQPWGLEPHVQATRGVGPCPRRRGEALARQAGDGVGGPGVVKMTCTCPASPASDTGLGLPRFYCCRKCNG